jgi:glycosyltransferase involved in cell wall biosynthesis
VVASEVASIPSAVVDGITGRLVPPRDPKMLAEALTTLVDSPMARHAMGRAGRDRTERAFALERCTAAFCRTLEQVYG